MSASKTTSRAAPQGQSPAVMMWVGFALTALITAYAFVDNATTRVLAHHIQESYPAYSASRVDDAVQLYVVILSVVGIMGVLSWLGAIWAVRAGRRRAAAWLSPLVLLIAMGIALAGLTVTDTSGYVGLAPTFAWLQLLPCLAGVVVVTQLWRQRR